MKIATGIFVASLMGLSLVAQINSPKIGTARYPDGSFHTVQGLPDNMIVADLPLDSAQAASFSDKAGLVAQGGSIKLLGADFSVLAEYPTTETPLLSVEGDAASALAWLPAAHALVRWTGTQFEAVELAASDVDGIVTGLQLSGSTRARLIVLHENGAVSSVTVSLKNGNLVSSESLPGVRGYAFGQGLFVVYAGEKELVVDNLTGYRRSLQMPATDFVIERMSSSWLHLYSPTLRQSWALHLTQADLHLSLLPGMLEKPAAALVSSAQGAK